MPFNSIYKDKKVLVTGHTGFKGSWLCIWLQMLKADVYGIALKPKTIDDNFVVTNLKTKINHHLCDIRNLQKLSNLFIRIRPQMVFHLAAQPLVKLSYLNPPDTFETNLMGTVHVLEAIRQTPSVEIAVMCTSDKCYKNVGAEWGYREGDELGGSDPYGASKACAEFAINSYRESFFNKQESPRVASVRAGNVIGGGDWSEGRLVPDIIRAISADSTVELRKPQAVRPWQFVLEALSGYLWLGARMFEDGDLASSWNFGPDLSTTTTVDTLAQMVIEKWGRGTIRHIPDRNDFHEDALLSLDCSKASYRLHWCPTLTLEEAVSFTVQWNKTYLKKESMFDFDVKQIEDYTKKARERGLEWIK